MPLDLTTFQKLQNAVDEKQRQADRAQGAYDQAMAQLKTEFGCATLADAKTKLAELEKQEKAATAAYEKALAAFLAEHGEKLGITDAH